MRSGNKNAPDCAATQAREREKNTQEDNTTERTGRQAIMHRDVLAEEYRAKYRVGQRLKLRWQETDWLDRNVHRTTWRPVEVVYIGEKFVVVRLLDLKDLFSGKPLNGYCVTVLYADLETGRAAMR